jgi:hypothetical protein
MQVFLLLVFAYGIDHQLEAIFAQLNSMLITSQCLQVKWLIVKEKNAILTKSKISY